MKVIALALALIASSLASHVYPGTSTRPILSASEAEYFTKTKYLQGWTPGSISTDKADYTVGSGGYSTIQSAVNAAVKAGGTTRKYIKIPTGTYNEVVYIPSTNVPLTIYGASETETIIQKPISATMSGSDYKSSVGHLFASGDPAYSIFSNCAGKSQIGTSCSAVFWVKANGVQIDNLTIKNLSKNSGTDQAVALEIEADKVQVHRTQLMSHQDTFYSGAGGTTVQRIHVTNSYIQGDIDYVFGGGSTVFEGCTFHSKGDRRTDESVVFAPDTDPHHEYGYLVIDSTIDGDSNWASSKNVFLARSWDAGVSSASAYVAGTSPNGQLVIRDSTIKGIVNTNAPYATATSGRTYKGNAATSRNLNDNSYNRFYEYNNKGDGA